MIQLAVRTEVGLKAPTLWFLVVPSGLRGGGPRLLFSRKSGFVFTGGLFFDVHLGNYRLPSCLEANDEPVD